MQMLLTNTIIRGDCLDKIKQYIPTESIDLIYLDPPFFSGKNYEIICKERLEDLEAWVERGVTFALELPSK